jgi:hypothetical protein
MGSGGLGLAYGLSANNIEELLSNYIVEPPALRQVYLHGCSDGQFNQTFDIRYSLKYEQEKK